MSLSVPAVAAEGAIAVIVDEDWKALDSITLPALRQIYLGRRSRLAGERVQCFDLAPGTSVRSRFGRLVLGMSESELRRHWLEQALTGGHPPPREVSSPEDAIRAVAQRPGAVAYLERETFLALRPEGVKAFLLEDGSALPLTSIESP